MSEPKIADASALSIPEQSPPTDDNFLLSPKEVRLWAKELPVANIGETARQIYNALVAFNRTEIPTLVRTEVVEIFRDPVRYINTNIAKHYANSGFPLSSRGRKAAQLANALCAELANAYKILFLDQLKADERNFNQKLIIVAAQRAILYLSERMYNTLMVYRDYPPNLWREANYLYAWAMQNHVEDIPVRESGAFSFSRKKARSIQFVYASMAMLATVNPYSLRQSQLKRLHARLTDWVPLVTLKPAWEAGNQNSIFYINLWSDEPPMRNYAGMQRRDARFVALDLSKAVEAAREEFEKAQWESPAYLETTEAPLSRTVLKPLIRHWTKTAERRFPRQENRTEIETVIGLSNLLRLLESRQQAQANNKQETKTRSRRSRNRSPSSRLTWNDSVFSTLSIQSPNLSLEGESSSFLSEPGMGHSSLLQGNGTREKIFHRNIKEPETLFTVLTYNQSVEGYCLAWHHNLAARVRVGDVLGIRSPQNPEQFGVGITRWLKQDRDNKVYIGLQILSTACSYVTLSPHARSGANRQNQYRCLMLSMAEGTRSEHSLMTNNHVFDLGTELTLNTEFGSHRIRLTRWLESNNNFVQYQFEYLDEPGQAEEEPKEDDFKNFWSEL